MKLINEYMKEINMPSIDTLSQLEVRKIKIILINYRKRVLTVKLV